MKPTVRVLSCVLAFLTACSQEPAGGGGPASGEPYVMTTFHPLDYMTRRIAGEHVEVGCPLPEGADPAGWSPSREAIAAYQGADLIVVNGADFEHWLYHVSLPESRVVRTTAVLGDQLLQADEDTHSHGGAEHSHEGLDGHTWLDPVLAKAQAQAVRDALARRFPEHARAFAANFDALAQDLDRVDARLREVSAKLAGTVLLASHPAYSYLARRYGWKLANVHVEPSAADLTDHEKEAVRAALAEGGKGLMLWESEPRESLARQLRSELAVPSVVFSPAENPPRAQVDGGQHFLAVMLANADRLEKALP